ncbi:MFS transporter [Kutzneria kofuensis]|uniref:MFS transporter n=1 Tax=Kutzneria kofuensis TaxID=103725 RepID=UPI0031E60910
MLTRRLTAVLAATCAVTSSNIYLIQPVLGQVAADLRIGEGTAGIVPTATQLGYAAGILLLVPLGDIRNRRPLILSMMAATTLALAGAALAPSVGWLAAAGFAIGLLTRFRRWCCRSGWRWPAASAAVTWSASCRAVSWSGCWRHARTPARSGRCSAGGRSIGARWR